MFGLESLTGMTRAVATVGLVVAESIILYVGYGVLTAVAGEQISDAIRK